MKTRLLNRAELEASSVVANNRMNRQRNAIGVNSYSKDLYFNPIDFLLQRGVKQGIRWLDLCCGEGKALIQAAELFQQKGLSSRVSLEGLDLVEYFYDFNSTLNLSLKAQNLETWIPEKEYDLITIVHGLHYVGDKIEVIRKSVSALKDDGLFVANIGLENIKISDRQNSEKMVLDLFEQHKLEYKHRRKTLSTMGKKALKSPFQYLGADDTAGPNYTGQEVVNSYYAVE